MLVKNNATRNAFAFNRTIVELKFGAIKDVMKIAELLIVP